MIFQNGVNLRADCENCFSNMRCVVQADETVLPSTSESPVVTESETTSFADHNTGATVGTPASETELDTSDAVTHAGLSDFLSRPVRILNFTWSESDPEGLTQTISPWNLFFNNTNIKYKLNNFAFLRANLKIKIVVNASPFYYGSMRACYQPLPSFKASTIISGTINGIANTEFMPYSQQPGVWIKPQTSEGGEMTLPFFYPRAFLKAQVAQDFTDMGTLRFIIYNALQSANGVTGQGVSVQVYAWAEDVVLAGPSVGLAMQAMEYGVKSDDEYGKGPVSNVASTVASIAGRFRSVPVLGKFATATEIGATAISGIAKLFGFTNVPVIDNVQPLRPSPFPQLASPEIGYPVEKLTLDAKNELSIDPSILGLNNDDELAIQHFVSRQSFVVYSTWSTSTPVDTPLFTSRVAPGFAHSIASSPSTNQSTPMNLVSRLFRSWRGDIIFTFRFIASPFHKGRVRISYDPYGNGVQTTADTGATVFNKIVDLGTETEVDVRVPYQQALAWCYTSPDAQLFTTSTTPALNYLDTVDNGIISVKVLTLLTAPVATSSVAMQVFVKGAENLEFANPDIPTNNLSAFVAQSKEYVEEREGEDMKMGNNSAELDVKRARLHFGENVRSLRVLLRRSALLDIVTPASNTSTSTGNWSLNQTRFPPYPGYDPGGSSSAKGIVVPASNFGYNFTNVTPWHHVANCFVAQRGSMHWHYNWEGPTTITMRAMRNPNILGTNLGSYQVTTLGTASANALAGIANSVSNSAGAALVNQQTNAGISVSYPNYSAFKFESTDPRNSTSPVTSGNGRYDGSCFEINTLEIDARPSVDDLGRGQLERYFGIGTDYSLYFFLNCPSLTRYAITGVTPN